MAYTRRIKGARIAGAREAMAHLVSEMVEAGDDTITLSRIFLRLRDGVDQFLLAGHRGGFGIGAVTLDAGCGPWVATREGRGAGATGFRDMKSLDRDVKGGHIAEVALQSASTMNRAMDSSSSRCPVAIRKDQSRGMGRPKATSRTVGRALRVAV